MKKIKLDELKHGLVNGIQVMLPEDGTTYQEAYFEWKSSTLVAVFSTCDVSGGVLRSWHHAPIFKEAETHIDREMFYFISGTAIMLFIDVRDGVPDLDSAQMVRVKPGTQLAIDAGKGHFVAVAADDEPVLAVVVSPKMDAPRVMLPDAVAAI